MKILVADDDDVTRRILQATLTKWGYEVVVASNGIEAWRVLHDVNGPKLALLDWMMPGMDGIEVCREIRKRPDQPYIYTLLLTGKSRKKDMISGLRAGADDYLSKPFHPSELKFRLRAGRRILDLQSQLVDARESLRYQATHDSLTDLLNRGAILGTLRNELETSSRRGLPLSVVLADFDHFKEINDTHGHLIGDAVLCEAAKRMKACIRMYDHIGRYGGEEFLFILTQCNGPDAMAQATRMKTSITSHPIELPRLTIAFTISLGIASRESPKPEDLDALVLAADTALYRAKAQGRNRIVLADEFESGTLLSRP